jgi:hypothetical protein
MVSQNEFGDTTPDEPSSVHAEEGLKPFQDASIKFLQANFSAQESLIKQRAQFGLDLQDEARKVEQEAYDAVMEATKKHVNNLGRQAAGGLAEMYYARAQSQLDYEKEVRQVYIDTQARMSALARRALGEDGGDAIKQFAGRQQDAYQAYLADLQQAWDKTESLDPRTVNAIASNILFTIDRL